MVVLRLNSDIHAEKNKMDSLAIKFISRNTKNHNLLKVMDFEFSFSAI